jgi:hypothetical protein
MEKTAYRIIPLKTFIADRYLQFKRINKRGKEIWCFVPEMLDAYVCGEYLTQENCPESLPNMRETGFRHSFYGHEKYSLIPFTLEYPDIEEYFKVIRVKHQKYLEDKQKERNDQTIVYL